MKLTKLRNVSLMASLVLAMLLVIAGCHDFGHDGGHHDEAHAAEVR